MIRTLSCLSLLGVLGACAAAPPTAAPAPARRPEIVELPVSAFIDSAALHQALLAAPPAPAEFRLKPLYVVVYDSTGALKEVRTMGERQFPVEYGRQMVELLRANVRPRIAATKPSVNYVWLQSGSSPRIAVDEALVEARPRLQNTSAVSRELSRASERLQRANPGLAGRSVTAQVAMRVSEEGVPEDPRLSQSTGNIQIDREIMGVAHTMRFAPANLSGYTVKVLVQLPITLTFPQAPQQPQPGMPPPPRP
jgi:hypothetical protein